MKNKGIKVTQLTNEEMLNHKEKEYNSSIWKERVNHYISIGAKFYESKPNEHFSYSRFYVEYTIPEGLKFISSFSPYHSSLTSNGFTRAFIIDGEIYTNGFGPERKDRVVNSKAGRKWLVDNICVHGVAVSSCL